MGFTCLPESVVVKDLCVFPEEEIWTMWEREQAWSHLKFYLSNLLRRNN